MAMKYKVSINVIDEIYVADDKNEALIKYANDAGYESLDHLKEQFPEIDIEEFVWEVK
tara:strand:- start:308 stop:481 length:174 start_codon:yes stop_codon:yes gene_type:complete